MIRLTLSIALAGTALFGHRFLVNGTARLTIDGTNQTTLNGALRVAGNLGVFNTAPIAKQTVTGSRAANAALASLLTALAAYGLVVDSSTV